MSLLACTKRCCYLGGSDVSKLFQKAARKKLLDYKTHQVAPDFFGNAATDIGTLLEPRILDLYDIHFKVDTQRKVYVQHPTYSWARGELDAWHVGTVVDAKSTSSTTKTFQDTWEWGIVPTSIVWQQRHYMWLANADLCRVPLYLRCRCELFKIFEIPRDAKEEEKLIEAEVAFAEEVMTVREELGDDRTFGSVADTVEKRIAAENGDEPGKEKSSPTP